MAADGESSSIGILVDLSVPEPTRSPTPEPEDDYLLSPPKQCSPTVLGAAGDFSFSLTRPRSDSLDQDARKTANDIMKLLNEEEFDFDLPVSPDVSDSEADAEEKPRAKDEDDEIFFGPVGHTEKCVAVSINEVAKVTEKLRPMSPLTANQMAELCREACTVACQIEIACGTKSSASSSRKAATEFEPPSPCSPFNDFLQTLSSALPTVDVTLLPSDSNGVVKFSAPSSSATGRPATRRSGGGGVAAAAGLRRAPAIKMPLSARASGMPAKQLVKLPATKATTKTAVQGPDGVKVKEDEQKMAATSALAPVVPAPVLTASCQPAESVSFAKRKCTMERSESADSISDTASITSDTSDASTVNPSTGKRVLPQPKFTRLPGPSKLPQFGSSVSKTTSSATINRRISSSVLTSALDVKDAAVADCPRPASSSPPSTSTATALHRSASIPTAKDSTTSRLPAPGQRVAGATGLKMPTVTRPESSLRQPSSFAEPLSSALPVPGSDKRKMLTAMRSLQLTGTSGARQGPMKAMPTEVAAPPKDIGQGDSSVEMAFPNANSDRRSLGMPSTPSRQEPKRSVSSAEMHTPRRNSCSQPPTGVESSSVQKRRSCLPSPARLNTSVSNRSEDKAEDADTSLLMKCQQEYTGSMKPNIAYTPQIKNTARHSLWSPVVRQKPFDREDEAIQCTKRTALKTTNT